MGSRLRRASRLSRIGLPPRVRAACSWPASRAPELVAALRAKLGPKAVLIAGDGFLGVPDLLKASGGAAVGMYVSIPGVATAKLGPVGRRFMRDFSATQPRGSVPSRNLCPGGCTGRRGCPCCDRPLRRHARIRPSRVAHDQDRERHPRQLPVRSERRHHAGGGGDLPHHRGTWRRGARQRLSRVGRRSGDLRSDRRSRQPPSAPLTQRGRENRGPSWWVARDAAA